MLYTNLGTNRWSNNIVNWWYNPLNETVGTTENIIASIQAAMSTWEASSSLDFIYQGTTEQSLSRQLDDKFVIGWLPQTNFETAFGDFSGHAQMWWDGTNVTDAEITLNSGSWTASNSITDFSGLMTHELGHVIGLSHSNDPTSIMFASPYHSYEYQRTLREDDISNVQFLYPQVNDSPVVASAIADATTTEDSAYSYDASSNFSDADGDTLTYTATLSNGNALPSWLSISSTGTLSGTPVNADVGVIEVTVTATDSDALTGSDTFTLAVSAVTTINLNTYAESTSGYFIHNSYKDLMGSYINNELRMFWIGKLNSGEADRASYLRMLGELPGDKLALINIDVEGSVGKDSFASKFGDGVSESFDGGSGIDTVTFDTAKSVISKTATGFTVGGDTLTNIERLSFTDTDIALDTDGANSAGGIYRTYQAAFNRTPDKVGFGYWIDRADNGASAVQMAEEFVWSAEFQTLYNVTTNDSYLIGNDIEAVVDLFYRNVLGRAPDQGGLTYYTSTIEGQSKTSGRVLAEIADSAENRTNLLPTIENGMSYDLWVG